MRGRGKGIGGTMPPPDACPSVRILSGRCDAGKKPPYQPGGIGEPFSSGGFSSPNVAANFTIAAAVTTSVAVSLLPIYLLELSKDSAMALPPLLLMSRRLFLCGLPCQTHEKETVPRSPGESIRTVCQKGAALLRYLVRLYV